MERDRILGDGAGRAGAAGVGGDAQRRRAPKEHSAVRIRRAGRVVDERPVGGRDLGTGDLTRGLGEEDEPAVHEPVLQRRHERDPDHCQRSSHDDSEGEAEPGADAAKRVHDQSRSR